MTHKIEITAISAEELVDNRKPVKKNAFVVFDMAGNYWKYPVTTSLDEVGGDHPIWEDKLETEFSSEARPTVLYVQTFRRSSREDKHVGTTRVPVKDFTGEFGPEGLWDDSGRRNGIVNFSVRIVPQKSDLGIDIFLNKINPY